MPPSAPEAAASAGRGDSVIGWKLDREQRKELLQQFPPRYGEVDADHVTLRTKAADDAPLPEETQGEIIGRADDVLWRRTKLGLVMTPAERGAVERRLRASPS